MGVTHEFKGLKRKWEKKQGVNRTRAVILHPISKDLESQYPEEMLWEVSSTRDLLKVQWKNSLSF